MIDKKSQPYRILKSGFNFGNGTGICLKLVKPLTRWMS